MHVGPSIIMLYFLLFCLEFFFIFASIVSAVDVCKQKCIQILSENVQIKEFVGIQKRCTFYVILKYPGFSFWYTMPFSVFHFVRLFFLYLHFLALSLFLYLAFLLSFYGFADRIEAIRKPIERKRIKWKRKYTQLSRCVKTKDLLTKSNDTGHFSTHSFSACEIDYCFK